MQEKIPTWAYTGSTDPTEQAQLQADVLGWQRKNQLAQALMNQGQSYIPNSGKLGVLAGFMSALRGSQLQKEADNSVTDIFRRYYDTQNKQALAARQYQLAEEQRKFNNDLALATGKAKAEQEAKRANPEIKFDSTIGAFVDPLGMKVSPNQQAQSFLLQKAQAGRPVTNLNMANESAFQKSLGEKDAGEFVKWRDQAISAQDSLRQADVIEHILSNTQTGKIPEAMAVAGQYFGTKAGASLQAFKGAIQPIVLARVKQLGTGSGISNADREFVEKGMPGVGNDARANAQLLDIMRKSSQAQIDQYQRAQDYVNKNKTLAGFMPSVPQAPAPTSATQAAKTAKDMSDAEILSALGLGQ